MIDKINSLTSSFETLTSGDARSVGTSFASQLQQASQATSVTNSRAATVPAPPATPPPPPANGSASQRAPEPRNNDSRPTSEPPRTPHSETRPAEKDQTAASASAGSTQPATTEAERAAEPEKAEAGNTKTKAEHDKKHKRKTGEEQLLAATAVVDATPKPVVVDKKAEEDTATISALGEELSQGKGAQKNAKNNGVSGSAASLLSSGNTNGAKSSTKGNDGDARLEAAKAAIEAAMHPAPKPVTKEEAQITDEEIRENRRPDAGASQREQSKRARAVEQGASASTTSSSTTNDSSATAASATTAATPAAPADILGQLFVEDKSSQNSPLKAADKSEASSAAPKSNAEAPKTAEAPAAAASSFTARFRLDAKTGEVSADDRVGRLTDSQQVRFVQRVTRAVQSASETDGAIRLRLSPPELGSVRVEVRVEAGQMSAHLEAETPQAQSLLMNNLAALRERLEQQDIKIARFDVSLFNNSPGNLPQTPERDTQRNSPLPRHMLRNGSNSGDALDAVSASAASSTSVGQLNVII